MRQPRSGPPSLAAVAALLLLASCGAPGVGGPVADAPMAAPNEQWSWIGFDDAVCGSGQTTGLGVNLTARSSDVVIYFLGGGACWDEQTCIVDGRAANLDTFNATTFALATLLAFPNTPLDRALPGNPFKDASLIFVPYCTGDLHAGTTVNTYGTRIIHHAGAPNVTAFLRRLTPTFPGARRIFVTGSSAGGYGAQINYARFVEAFPDAEVHMLADSAQAVQPSGTLYATWLAAWRPTIPPGCTACTTDLTALPAWLSATYPSRRFGLLAFQKDTVLPGYFDLTQEAFEAGTLDLLSAAYGPTANARYFALPGPGHVMLAGDLSQSVGGVTLQAWLTRWYRGDAAWASVKP